MKAAEPAKIVDISDFRSWERGCKGKRRRRLRTTDDKFASLNVEEQIAILSHVIGYINASKDLISYGKQVRTNEISKIFEAVENMVIKEFEKL